MKLVKQRIYYTNSLSYNTVNTYFWYDVALTTGDYTVIYLNEYGTPIYTTLSCQWDNMLSKMFLYVKVFEVDGKWFTYRDLDPNTEFIAILEIPKEHF